MIDGILALPPQLRERLATHLDAGYLDEPYTLGALRAAVGSSGDLEPARRCLEDLAGNGLNPAAIAAWVRSVARAAGAAPRVDLVWSGPEVPGIHARDTRRVMEELIDSSSRSLWITTYAFFDGPKAFERLAARMDAVLGLDVRLLLNVQRKRGDTTSTDDLVRRFASKFWSKDWPGQARPMVFYDPRALDPAGPSGVLHAKAVVADDEVVFVTSANLTEAAFDRNIELGLLTRDRALAQSVVAQLRALVERGLLHTLPAS